MDNADGGEELKEIQEELIDRFGELPAQAQTLLDTHRLRIAAKPLGIIKIDASETRINLQFVPNPPIEPIRIIQLIQKNRQYKLTGQDKLTVTVGSETLKERVLRVREVLKALGA